MPFYNPNYSQSQQLWNGIQGFLGDTDKVGRIKSQLAASLTDPTTGALMGGPWGSLGQILYHGTTAQNAANIAREGFNPLKFGTGADKNLGKASGFLGRGVYGTPDASVAHMYSVMASPVNDAGRGIVKFHIPDDKLLDLSNLNHRQFRQAINLNETLQVRPMVKAIRRYAQRTGRAGVNYPGDETVIFDPRAIDYMERTK